MNFFIIRRKRVTDLKLNYIFKYSILCTSKKNYIKIINIYQNKKSITIKNF